MSAEMMPARQDWNYVQIMHKYEQGHQTDIQEILGPDPLGQPEGRLECPPLGAALGISFSLRHGLANTIYLPIGFLPSLSLALLGSPSSSGMGWGDPRPQGELSLPGAWSRARLPKGSCQAGSGLPLVPLSLHLCLLIRAQLAWPLAAPSRAQVPSGCWVKVL